MMSGLPLSVAIGDYDRTERLLNGRIPIDGAAPIFLELEPEEIFFRALRHSEFDVCELSMSSYCAGLSRGDFPYIAIPAFPSRAFRHTAFYVRTDGGITSPADLKGKRIGLPEYQLTACVWVRIVMSEAGVEPDEVEWIRAGLEQSGRPEKIKLNLPKSVKLRDAAPGKTLSNMLVDGEIDAIIAPRPPSCFRNRHPAVRWLFSDPAAAAADYFSRTGIFPIMHLVAIRRDTYAANRWLPSSLLKAFTLAKDAAIARLEDNSAAKCSLPFLEERVTEAMANMGRDYWAYGYGPNKALLDLFVAHHHKQGLSARLLKSDELFAPEAAELFAI